MIHLLRAEAVKLFSLPSVWLTLVVTVGAVPVIARAQRSWLPGESTITVLRMVPPYVLVGAAVLGVLVACGEYVSCQIVATLLAVPRRARLLVAKLVVVAVAAVASSGGALALGRMSLSLSTWSLAEMRMVAIASLVHASVAVLSCASAVAIRHLVASTATACGLILVAPVVLGPWPKVSRWLVDAVGRDLYADTASLVLPSWQAAVALVAWVVGAVAIGAARLLCCDA